MTNKTSPSLFSLALQGVQGLTPYEPGKPIEEVERELGISNIIKLASNENPLGMSPKAKEAIKATIDDAYLYPDGNAFNLKVALSKKHGVEFNQLTIGNGSNDILEIVARCFADANSEIMYSQYAFAVYPILTQGIGARHNMVPAKDWGHDLTAMLNAITPETKIIFIANPNNPTGTYLLKSEIASFLSQIPSNIIVVMDEAYHEFISNDDYCSAEAFLSLYPNLIVSRTFSKVYGLAGLRIGYALSHPDICNILNRVRQPFNANMLALVAAEAALSDEEFLKASVELNNYGLRQLADGFDALGLTYIPSVANFIAVDVNQPGSLIYQALLQKGVIVRPIGGYKMPNHIRVSVGTESENKLFLTALEKILKVS